MTPKSKRELERALEALRDTPRRFDVTSSVVTITDDMTDESGTLIEERVPDSDPPEGYTREAFGVQSDVVDVYRIEPADG